MLRSPDRHDIDRQLAAAADDLEVCGRTGRPRAQRAVELVDTLDRRITDPHDQVAIAQARARGRAVRLDALHLDGRTPYTVVIREAAIERAPHRADTEPGAAHTPVLQELPEDPARGLDGDREADALRAADDRRVDAEHAATAVE